MQDFYFTLELFEMSRITFLVNISMLDKNCEGTLNILLDIVCVDSNSHLIIH